MVARVGFETNGTTKHLKTNHRLMSRMGVNPRSRRRAIRKLSVATIWVASVASAVSFYVIRSGHTSSLWAVLQNCAIGLWDLAVAYQVYYYWWQRRRGEWVEDKALPNEAQITRLVRRWREQNNS